MRPISYKRHRFPPEVIRQAVWLYFKFTLSLRDVEVICPLQSGPFVNLDWTLKERENGQEARA